jgi:hypothetical protein
VTSLDVAAIAVTTEDPTLTNHAQRAAFAGALFANTVPRNMMAAAALANPTLAQECLANPQQVGGNIADNDLDFRINSIFTGLATSRSWV